MEFHKDLEVKYEYRFTVNELNAIKKFRNTSVPEQSVEKVIELIFTSLILVMGVLVRNIIDDNFEMEVISAYTSLEKNKKTVFIVSIRQKEKILNEFYFKSELFHLSELFSKHIPRNVHDKLQTEKNLIYLLALDRYNSISPHIIAVLGRIYNKCSNLKHITPLLDLMNFVCSRVEDSHFETETLMNEFLGNKHYSKAQIKAILDLFGYINNNAGLFATYQSNNRPQLSSQYRLFVLYSQYFILNQKSVFQYPQYKKSIEKLSETYKNTEQYLAIIQEFLLSSFFLSQYPSVNIVTKKIFNREIMTLNENFFSVFLHSVNIKFFKKLDFWNRKLKTEALSYNDFIKIITEALYYIIDLIFLEDDLEKASHNFRDHRGRYSPKRVALRTLEILMFRELPLSDNNWKNYNLSRNQEQVRHLFEKYIHIPEDYFFSKKRLVHISMMYMFGIEERSTLEEWLISSIFTPFFTFCERYREKLSKNFDEAIDVSLEDISKYLFKEIYNDLSKGIIKDRTLDDLELISEWLADLLSKHLYNL